MREVNAEELMMGGGGEGGRGEAAAAPWQSGKL